MPADALTARAISVGNDANSLKRGKTGIVLASSAGTLLEWYDFFLYGALAPIIARQFFGNVDPDLGLILALLAFSAGGIVRPFGAIAFGPLGDRSGRKYTFVVTMLLMCLSTLVIASLPTYDVLGGAAPILLIAVRLLQGLAMGGEYGGAAVYVAEHAPDNRRGLFTSCIQTTATLGLLLALGVIVCTRRGLGEVAFASWGWRIPFLLSFLLLAISVWVRLRMAESPVFAQMKAEGKLSKAPLADAFGHWANLNVMLAGLFGITCGLGAVWYANQFYVLLFLTQTLQVDGETASVLVGLALIFTTPLFVIFGALSDRVGRKKIVLGGILLSAIFYIPIFQLLTHFANPALENALARSPVVVSADPKDCHFQFSPGGMREFTSSCDIAKAKLVAASVKFRNEPAFGGSVAAVMIGDRVLTSYNARRLSASEAAAKSDAFTKELAAALQQAGYPSKADPGQMNKPMVFFLIFLLALFITMAYGPAAALLVELFPARIRYSSLSFVYHLGTGWFGSLMPAVAFALVAYKGDVYYGLYYPFWIALATVIIGVLSVPETKGINIRA
jgi:MFS family permease